MTKTHRLFSRFGAMLLAVGCEPEPEVPPLPTFEPVSVGIGFDGVVRSTGVLSGYGIDGQTYAPALILQFVSEAWFDTTDPAVAEIESCVLIATFEPPPLVLPDQIPTVDDAPLFVSYDTALVLDATSCAGRADPEVWGDDAEVLVEAFDGAHLGLGIGPMTDRLRESYTAETLADYGASMLALWVALADSDDTWVATDRTMALAYQWDEATGQLVSVTDAAGNVSLLEVDVSGLGAADPLPAVYLQSFPTEFQELASLDLENLDR